MTIFLPFLIGRKIYFHFLEKQLNISICFLIYFVHFKLLLHIIKYDIYDNPARCDLFVIISQKL
jgi:hypothetical protein